MKKITPIFAVLAAIAGAAYTLSPSQAPQRIPATNASKDVGSIPEYNFQLSDIAQKGLTSTQLFNELDPDGIILGGNSVCANRALMWNWRMKQMHNIDSGKVFVFYTRGFTHSAQYVKDSGGVVGTEDEREWYYHVAPYVVENGQEVVIDHGFTPNSKRQLTPVGPIEKGWDGNLTRPVTMKEWMLRFPKTTQCQEITAQNENITRQFITGSIDAPTRPGEARCYFRKTPMHIWTPLTLAALDLQLNAKGEPNKYRFIRDMFHEADVVQACEEAVSEDGVFKLIGRGAKLEVCLKYLGLDRQLPAYMNHIPSTFKKYSRRKERALSRLMGERI